MHKWPTLALLIAALAAPVVAFLMLNLRLNMSALFAGLIAVGAGWLMNVAWANSMRADGASAEHQNFVRIASLYGWACPTALVLVTWVALKLIR